MNFFKRKLKGFILSVIPGAEDYEKKLSQKKIKNCEAQVIMGSDSKFYEEARVFNMQGKREKIRIGSGTHMRNEFHLFGYGGEIIVGDHCYIGEGTRIWSGEQIIIGDNVLISHNVNIVDTNAHEIDHIERAERYRDLLRNGHPKNKASIITAKISIGNHAWINFNSIILKGVSIGEGAIVAAGSVVTKDVERFTVVAGNPARVVKKLEIKNDKPS